MDKNERPLSRAAASISPEDQELLILLGHIIRGRRIQLGLKREEAADRLLIGHGTIARIEAGDPRVAMGYYLAACRLVDATLLEPTALISETRRFDNARKRASSHTHIDDSFS